jgi:M6 family metalloprotease-like protein
MHMHLPRILPAIGLLLSACTAIVIANDTTKTPDLADYRTVETAIQVQAAPASATSGTSTFQPGYLGVHLDGDASGAARIAAVALESPAAKAGLKPGDHILKIDAKDVQGVDQLRQILDGKSAGDGVKFAVEREKQTLEVKATLGTVSRPMKPGPQRPYLGIVVEANKAGEGVVIGEVTAESPAARARLKTGEVILKLDGVDMDSPDKFREALAAKKADEEVTLTLSLAEKSVDYKVRLGSQDAGGMGRRGFGGPGGWDARASNYWKKDVYRLAIILIDYPDIKNNPKFGAKAWEDALFSRGTYKKTVSDQTAYGSMADYYWEQSYQTLKVEGKCFTPVEVSKKRPEYGQGGNRFALLTEALDKLIARDGKDALKDFDGINFIYAGGRMNVARGSLYWPHRASVAYQGKRWPYFICGEGGERFPNISVFAHEFGHMLGLPDLYARPENPGSEGLSIWCAMSNQAGNGRPQHFCAWAKERLGWVKPTTIDPRVKQKLILLPIEDSPKECFKVLLRPDGSEYLLLENRRKKGFDESLPAEGLLIWRVVGNRPVLQEAHGIEGPNGPRVFQSAVPYPSPANTAFTPYTTPSSRAQLGGGHAVYITNINRLADGRVTFHIGYEYQ